jgi:hypothetical protein
MRRRWRSSSPSIVEVGSKSKEFESERSGGVTSPFTLRFVGLLPLEGPPDDSSRWELMDLLPLEEPHEEEEQDRWIITKVRLFRFLLPLPHSRLTRDSYDAVLGVEYTASADEIKKAYVFSSPSFTFLDFSPSLSLTPAPLASRLHWSLPSTHAASAKPPSANTPTKTPPTSKARRSVSPEFKQRTNV